MQQYLSVDGGTGLHGGDRFGGDGLIEGAEPALQ